MALSINGSSTASAAALRQAQSALLIRSSTQSNRSERTAGATQGSAILEDSDGLRAKVQDAIQEALKANSDSDPETRMQAVEEAVRQTLEDSGIDDETIESAVAALAPGGAQAASGVQSQGGPPPGPPPGGPPPAGGPGGPPPSESSTSSTESTDESTASAFETLLDSDLSFSEVLQQLLAAAEEQTEASETTNETGSTTDTSSSVTGAISSLLSGDASLEDLVTQLASAWQQREAEDERAARMAYTLTSALFGPAVNAYA